MHVSSLRRVNMSGTFNMNEMFRTCGVCGKEVSIRGTYKYKRLVKGKTVYYCGWNCYNRQGRQDVTRNVPTTKE